MKATVWTWEVLPVALWSESAVQGVPFNRAPSLTEVDRTLGFFAAELVGRRRQRVTDGVGRAVAR